MGVRFVMFVKEIYRVLTTRPAGKSQVPVADILNPEGVLPGLKEDA